MSIATNPTNTNLLQASKFLMSFDRLPTMAYFCTEVNIPGVSTGAAVQVTPFIDAPIPGDKMVYDNFEIDFIVDEDLLGWEEILKWIKGYAFPESFDQYKNLSMQDRIQMGNPKPQYSDATLIAYSNKNNPIMQFQFQDIFPISVSDIKFDTKLDATNVISASAKFRFTNYTIVRTV
jgi:hypothetical protein